MTLAISLLAFALMVLIHELGHFITAKITGVEVKEFALGFGKKLFSKKYGETEYSLRLIPLGGFNDINLEDDNGEKSFCNKSLPKRLLILVAGSGFNLISAFVMLIFIVSYWGVPTATNEINILPSNYVAGQYLQNNDIIKSYNGISVNIANQAEYEQFSKTIRKSEKLNLVVERNGQEQEIVIDKPANQILGISFVQKPISQPFPENFLVAGKAYRNILSAMYEAIIALFEQEEKIEVTEVISGPVGVTQIMTNATNQFGGFGLCLTFVLVSINLGIMNLLPLPILDGGHITIQTIEAITGKELPQKDKIIYVGAGVLIVIFAIGLYSDLTRILYK